MAWYAERNQRGVLVGLYRQPQPGRAEELLQDNDPEVIAHTAPQTTDQREAECIAAMNGGGGRIDMRKLIIAKCVSDEAYRLGKAPGTLTGAELAGIRARIAAIYKAL